MRRAAKTIIATATFIMLIAGAASAQEFRPLWSDHHNEVLDKHNAAIYTPVSRPNAAIDWQYSIGESQRAYFDAYPKDRIVVQRVNVVRDQALAEVEPQTMDINGREVPIQQDW